MSDSFRLTQKERAPGFHVEGKAGRVVKPLEQRKLSSSGFTPERAPEIINSHPSAKNSRFQISELTRPYLPMLEEERAAIEAEVRSQVDAIARETYEAARLRGLEEGRELGAREAREELLASNAPYLKSLQALVAEFEGMRKVMFEANERFLMELIVRIARKVCLQEISGDTQYLQRLARAMVEQSGARENIRIRLNPGQVDTISLVREELAKSLGELRNVQIELSADVPEGSCQLETDFSSMSAGLDSQIDAIHDALVMK
jgi:flagellar biosynthesis/type III secretory pathway protein FliH